ncbi:protein SpAN-like isoform X2 [Patiria miniata]|uniref:Metalloendopeptidase n=1 Tax=Patiria miniata TaxID=46514 RepID=A0A914AI25_PATMI|nr:protein SpAN-like isoform X2 [Patiria miniata]
MRLILLAMFVACALAASTNRVRRGSPFEKGDRKGAPKKLKPDAEGEDKHSVARRSAPATWDAGKLCYLFVDGFGDAQMKTNVRRAMDRFEAVSCVTFIEADTGDSSCTSSTSPKIEIKNDKAGCWADVGCHPTLNRVNVATTCDPYDQIGVLMHELFHAMGRYHEHTRPDRDQFVTILYGNIKEDQEHNFEKHSSADFLTYGIKYDYESIMHYGTSFFAKSSGPTLEVKDPLFANKIGKQKDFSTRDILYLNNMYQCYNGDPSPCEHRGARKADGSCYCIHPFTGQDCQDVASGVEVFENDGSAAIIVKSLNYPDDYPLNTKTETLLKCTDASKKAQMEILDFAIEGYGCYYDKFTYTIMGNDLYPDVKCEDQLAGKTVTAEDSSILITLSSDDMYTFKGYKISFTCV